MAEARKLFEAIKYVRQPAFQNGALDLHDVPVQYEEGSAAKMLVDCKERDGGCIIVRSRLRSGVNHRENGVADRRKGNRAAVNQQVFAVEEGDAGPIDEIGKVFLGVDERIVLADQVGPELLPPPQPDLFAFIRKALWEKRIVHGRRMMLMEAMPRVGADVIKEIIEVLASCVRANECLAAVVVEGRSDRIFSQIAIIEPAVRLSPFFAKAASSMTILW